MNEHFTWKVAHVDCWSMTPTVNACSSMGLVEIARFICVLRRGYTLSQVAQSGVYTARTLEFMAGRVAAGRGSLSTHCPALGHLVWGTLYLGALQELVHQGRLLC